MEIIKDFKDISWQVTEPQYRADSALSYSTLAKYEREGFNKLDHLFDKVESPSLAFGSAVDTIITDGMEAFNNSFIVLDASINDSGRSICAKLRELYPDITDFAEFPEYVVSNAAKEVEFWKADKWDNRRYTEVLKTGNIAEYYNAISNNNKTIIDPDTYNSVLKCVEVLKTSTATSGYFADNDPLSPIKRYYQLKFKARFDNVNYRCMADLIIVDYEDKKIYPIDLKTSGHSEWDFQDSFMTWHYMIQARLYWRIIKANMLKDPYFKDFSLENYKFIVVNKYSLTPLVWEFPLTTLKGTLVNDDGKEFRDPFEIGTELQSYLNLRPQVPTGIDIDGVNMITSLKLKS